MFPQVGVAEGVEYTSRSFTYHHAALAQVDDHHDGAPDDDFGGGDGAPHDDGGGAPHDSGGDDDLQVVEAAVMSAKASPVIEEVGKQ